MRRAILVLLFLLPLNLYAQGAGTPPFRGSATWNLIWPSDNTFDIGASGATRPRTGYFGTSVVTPALTVSGLTSGRVPVASTGGSFVDFSTFTFSGGTVTATNLVATSGVTAASVTDSGLTSGRVTLASTGGLLTDDADLTLSGTRTTATDLTVTNFPTFSAGTSTRVPFFGSSGVVTDDADMTFATDTLSVTKLAAGAGASSATSIRMTDDNTGFAEVTSTNWGWYVNGTESVRLGSTGQVGTIGGISLGPSISAPDAQFTRSAAGVARFSTNGTSVRGLLGGGSAVASATALAVPAAALYHVTGTTTITSITSTNIGTGTCIILIFDGALTFTDGSNLKLAGDFVTTADDTIGVCYDGTNWYETHRSVN